VGVPSIDEYSKRLTSLRQSCNAENRDQRIRFLLYTDTENNTFALEVTHQQYFEIK
jgi:hypothetical protein